jgi:pimeloyl-ACP methyl ester carboxylesterase
MSLAAFGIDKFVTVHGLPLHYVEWGQPGTPSLVLLHGFQSNAHTWDTFSAAMASTYHVLALDQRGHGDTGWAPGGDYASEAFIRDIIGFIEALQLAPAVLVGHSMGGRHAAMVAADHPQSVRKIIIVDTPAELPPHMLTMLTQQSATAEEPSVETFATFEEVITHGMAQYPLTPEAELRHANYHNLYRGMDGKWHWRWDPMLLVSRRRNRSLQGDLYAALRRVSCPALLIRGASSPLLTPEVARKMLQVLPNGQMVEIPAAAHTVNADNAAEFERVTAAFLRE